MRKWHYKFRDREKEWAELILLIAPAILQGFLNLPCMCPVFVILRFLSSTHQICVCTFFSSSHRREHFQVNWDLKFGFWVWLQQIAFIFGVFCFVVAHFLRDRLPFFFTFLPKNIWRIRYEFSDCIYLTDVPNDANDMLLQISTYFIQIDELRPIFQKSPFSFSFEMIGRWSEEAIMRKIIFPKEKNHFTLNCILFFTAFT